MCNTLRQWACAAWIVVVACSDGSGVALVVSSNSADPTAPGALPPGAVSPDGVSAEGASLGGAIPSAGSPQENPPPSTEPGGPLSPPPTDEAPASASGEESQPNATETNFFSALCRQDTDCGETRRCELPADAGAATVPAADAGLAAAPAASGRCVAR